MAVAVDRPAQHGTKSDGSLYGWGFAGPGLISGLEKSGL